MYDLYICITGETTLSFDEIDELCPLEGINKSPLTAAGECER